jgi:competence protein ComEC
MPCIAALPALALLVGCVLGVFTAAHAGAWCLAGTCFTLMAWGSWWRRHDLPTSLLLFLAFLCGGGALAAHAQAEADHPPLRALVERLTGESSTDPAAILQLPAIAEGELEADASPGERTIGLDLDVSTLHANGTSYPIAGGVRVAVAGALAKQQYEAWTAGRRIRAPMELRRPSRYFDPGVPDAEQALARRGTTMVGVVKSGALVEVLARGSSIDEAAARMRVISRHVIARAVGRWSAQSAAIVAAIVLGDRLGLGQDLRRQLQEAGTYHVIAISGGNIAILAGLVLALFGAAGLTMRIASVAAIGVLAGYAMLVGGGASVNRATVMAALYLGARALEHRSSPFNALAATGGLLLACSPLSIFDAGFVLTFGATAAILIGGGWMGPHLPESTWLRAPAALLLASLCAEAALLPVGALVFSRVTGAGLVLNFLAIPLMGLAQIAGMALLPAAALSWRLAEAIGWLAHVGAAGLVWSAGLVRFAPWAAVRVPTPSAWVVMLYYVAGVAALTVRGRRIGGEWWRSVSRGAAAVAVFSAVWIVAAPATWLLPRGRGRLQVVFFDVGQGDSILVRFPRGHTLLVDTGGLREDAAFDIGDRVVGPALRALGVRHLDYLALSHGDADHMAGAFSIVHDFAPRELWEGVPVPPFEPLQRLRAETDATAIGWRIVQTGDAIAIDGAEVMVRHPPPPDWERQKVRNDDSIVLDVRFGEVSLLLTGDISREVEPEVASHLEPAAIRILKVAHHGSGSSSTTAFLRLAHPTIAIASAGRGNPFGHPVPATLARLRAAGAEIFRTDHDGAVFVDTDGHDVHVRTWTGRTYELTTTAQRH